jgi:hypothetical protein
MTDTLARKLLERARDVDADTSSPLPFLIPRPLLNRPSLDSGPILESNRTFFQFGDRAQLLSSPIPVQIDAFFTNYLTKIGYLKELFRPGVSYILPGGDSYTPFATSSTPLSLVHLQLESVFSFGSTEDAKEALEHFYHYTDRFGGYAEGMEVAYRTILNCGREDLWADPFLPQVDLAYLEGLLNEGGGRGAAFSPVVQPSAGLPSSLAASPPPAARRTPTDPLPIPTFPYIWQALLHYGSDEIGVDIFSGRTDPELYSYPLPYQLVLTGDYSSLELLKAKGLDFSTLSPEVRKAAEVYQFEDILALIVGGG